MKDTVAPRRLATSRPHESQGRMCQAAKRPLFNKTKDFSESLWHPAITKSHGTEKNVRYSEDPAITNYLVNNKSIRYSEVTKLNQAEQWDIHHAKQSTELCVKSYI